MRVSVYGLGRIGETHARNASRADGVDEVVLIGRDADRAASAYERVRTALGSADDTSPSPQSDVRVTTDPLGDVLPALDGIVVATATDSHPELARFVAESRTPLLIEKPLALTADHLTTLAADLEATGTPIMVAFQRRYDAGYQACDSACSTATSARCER